MEPGAPYEYVLLEKKVVTLPLVGLGYQKEQSGPNERKAQEIMQERGKWKGTGPPCSGREHLTDQGVGHWGGHRQNQTESQNPSGPGEGRRVTKERQRGATINASRYDAG